VQLLKEEGPKYQYGTGCLSDGVLGDWIARVCGLPEPVDTGMIRRHLSLPFVYSNEVWTGIEYQVASHLILEGRVAEGLDIVRTCRDRYAGNIRNPFDEYECGHWYARAMSSYALLEALTGVRYDAVERTLFVNSKVGDFTSFLSTATGFGNVIFSGGKVRMQVVYGDIPVKKIVIKRT
jgi:hypothetical protein